MVRPGVDEQGRSVVEIDSDDIVFFESNIHGRSARDRLAAAIEKDLLSDRESGRNTYSGERIRRLAYDKAVRLVAEKAAEFEQKHRFA